MPVGGVGDHRCEFTDEPDMPYYWDDSCEMGVLGCNADGTHVKCRFCGHRPFEGIDCPEEVAPPRNRCYFPEGTEPIELYFWDAECVMGMLGCWADGIHAECRFCGGEEAYKNVSCPVNRVTGLERSDVDEEAVTPESAAKATRSESTHERAQPSDSFQDFQTEDEAVPLSHGFVARPTLALLIALALLAIAPLASGAERHSRL